MRVSATSWLARHLRRLGHSRGLLASRKGAPALEFALMAPLLLTMALGVDDVANALITQRQVTSTAREAAEIATGLAANTTTQQSILTAAQAQAAASVIYAEMPGLKNGSRSKQFSVTLTSVEFEQQNQSCVATASAPCAYVGKVIWSVPLNEGLADTSVKRPLCVNLTQVSAAALQALPSQQQYLTSLPTAGVTAPSSMLIADVFYQFTPLFGFISGPLTFRRTAFLPPRVGNTPAAFVYYEPANYIGTGPVLDPQEVCPTEELSLPTGSS